MSPRPGPGRLAALDQRVVPWLAQRLRRLSGRRRRPPGTPVGPVRRLARREPTMLAAVVVVVLAAGLLLATGAGRSHRAAPARSLTASSSTPGSPVAVPSGQPSTLASSAPSGLSSTPSQASAQLGPSVGEQVSAYLSAVARHQAAMRALPPAATVTAVVDLTGYLTPAVVTGLVAGSSGVQLAGAFAQAAPPATGDVHALTLSAADGLDAALRSVRASARTIAANYRKLRTAARHHPTPQARRVVRAYRDLGREAIADLAGVGPGKGCVFAVVVTGAPAALLRLAADPDVRAVDPDSDGVPTTELRIVPLPPQTTGRVGALAFAGG